MATFDWVALWGAITGTMALGWEIFLYWRSGPKLKIAGRMDSPVSDNCDLADLIKLSIRNKGTAHTTIESISVSQDGVLFKCVHAEPDVPCRLEAGDHLAVDLHTTDGVVGTWSPWLSAPNARCLDASKPAVVRIQTSASDKDIVLKIPAWEAPNAAVPRT